RSRGSRRRCVDLAESGLPRDEEKGHRDDRAGQDGLALRRQAGRSGREREDSANTEGHRQEEPGVGGRRERNRDAQPDLVDRPDHFADGPAEGRRREKRPGDPGPASVPRGREAAAGRGDEGGHRLAEVVNVDRRLVADPAVLSPRGEEERENDSCRRSQRKRPPACDAKASDRDGPPGWRYGGCVLHRSSVCGGTQFRTAIGKTLEGLLSQPDFHLTWRGSYL